LGMYAASATVTMTSTNNISLTGITSPILSFWTRWDIETGNDCGVLQISTNSGSTWTALTGTLSKAASGSGKQTPSGTPIYDGAHLAWTQETVDLSSYSGKQIKLRFALWTDASTNKDGWYVDDIAIYYYGVLPVELISFTAKSAYNNIVLNWKTATELNNIGFQIQRSNEMNTPSENWKTLGFIKGNGSTSTSSSYSFTDISPLQDTQYYRLKQIDANGTYTIYGPIVENNLSKLDFYLEQNYPNPFAQGTKVRFTISKLSPAKVTVFDLTGREVAILVNELLNPGTYEVSFDGSNFAGGTYFYKLETDGMVDSRRMILVK